MSDLQFLYLDICLMTVLAIVMGRGGPSDELYSCRPPASLLALPVLGSIFIQTCLVIIFQLAALFITTSQEWCVKGNQSATLTHAVLHSEAPSPVFLFLFFYSKGIFHLIPRCMETPICLTWRTPVCFTCLDSSTSSWPWWSPRATLTRNLCTTTVSLQGARIHI